MQEIFTTFRRFFIVAVSLEQIFLSAFIFFPYVSKASKRPVTSKLPQVGVDENGEICVRQGQDGDVHVYASGMDKVLVHQENSKTGRVENLRSI